jgi:hypothetical protein
MAEIPTVSKLRGTYWIGLALFLLGGILLFGGIRPSRFLIVLGFGIVVLATLVECYRILKTSALAGVLGYREGQRNGR